MYRVLKDGLEKQMSLKTICFCFHLLNIYFTHCDSTLEFIVQTPERINMVLKAYLGKTAQFSEAINQHLFNHESNYISFPNFGTLSDNCKYSCTQFSMAQNQLHPDK